MERGKKVAKEGDKFIRPDTNKVYIVKKIVLEGNWIILFEEGEEHQLLTSQESLKTWVRKEEDQ
jgi:hypothetical protein